MNALLSLSALGILTMFLGVQNQKKWILPSIGVGLGLCFFLNLLEWNHNHDYLNHMMVVDNFAIAFSGALIFTTFIVFMFASTYYRSVERPLEDIYALMIFSLAGGVVMTSFGNMIMLFVGIEILSITMYILAGSKKFDLASNEASLKYFLTGSFATGFLLLGIALVYGATGTFDLAAMADCISLGKMELPGYFKIGMLLIMIGLAFKLAIAPFHFWAPDVYHGSPTLITAFMSTVVKIAGIAAFYRLFSTCFGSVTVMWSDILAVFAAVTIIVGNFTGLFQDNMKRMLAYSSVSHAGYLVLGILGMNHLSAGALLLYTVSYAIATVLAFGIIILVREIRKNDDIETFNGLAKANPYMALTLTIALLSLTGIPPLAGFAAKYYIFTSAVEGGYTWLVILAVLGSAVSAVYYFRPIIAMYMKEGDWEPVSVRLSYRVHIIIVAVLTLLLGILPGLIVGLL